MDPAVASDDPFERFRVRVFGAFLAENSPASEECCFVLLLRRGALAGLVGAFLLFVILTSEKPIRFPASSFAETTLSFVVVFKVVTLPSASVGLHGAALERGADSRRGCFSTFRHVDGFWRLFSLDRRLSYHI